MGEASKSVQEASKSAIEASKTAAGVSKNTFEDLTYVGKSTLGDLTKSAKEAAAKKGLLKVSLLVTSPPRRPEIQIQTQIIVWLPWQGLGDSEPSPPHSPPYLVQRKDSGLQLANPDSRSGRREIGRDFFSNISNDLNGIAEQTSSMFSGFFGKSSPRSLAPG
jgi:hypothetical protein